MNSQCSVGSTESLRVFKGESIGNPIDLKECAQGGFISNYNTAASLRKR